MLQVITARQQAVNRRRNCADSKNGGRHEKPLDGVWREDGDDVRLPTSMTQELSGDNLCASDEVLAGDRFSGKRIRLQI